MHNNKKTIFFITLFTFLLISFQQAFAQTADINIVTKIVLEFNNQTESWYKIFQNVAKNLFYIMAVIELAHIGIQVTISTEDFRGAFRRLLMFALTGGFFIAVLVNYQEWSQQIIRGLQAVAGQTGSSSVNSDNPMLIGIQLFHLIKDAVGELDLDELHIALFFFIAGFILLICFTLMTANIIIIKCESIVATLAAFILMGFGASSFTKDYAVNTLRYVLSVAFKLFTMQLIMNIGLGFAEKLNAYEIDIENCIVMVAFSLVLLVLSQKIPEIVAGIIQGAHSGGGGGLMGGAQMVGGMIGAGVGGLVGGGAGAVGGAKALSSASKIAQAEGSSGAIGTFKALNTARQQVNMKQTSIGNELKGRLATINELKK